MENGDAPWGWYSLYSVSSHAVQAFTREGLKLGKEFFFFYGVLLAWCRPPKVLHAETVVGASLLNRKKMNSWAVRLCGDLRAYVDWQSRLQLFMSPKTGGAKHDSGIVLNRLWKAICSNAV